MKERSGALSGPLFERGRKILGVRYPILCGAMTWLSDARLVSAVAEAGGFGCLAGGNAPPEILKHEISAVRKATNKPFGVNLITIAPAYPEQLRMAESMSLPVVIFAGSFPKRKEVERIKAAGSKVFCFASAQSIARRMIDYGADGLILEGMEAGGHIGHVSLIILLQQVLFETAEIPVFVAGGIGTGRMCAHLLLMGAAGVQMGTVFSVAGESCAHPEFKRKMVQANARDAVATPQFDSRLPIVAVRALRNKGLEDFSKLQLRLVRELDEGKIGRQEAQEEAEKFWVGALRRAVLEGDVEHGSLMAGQSVGLVNRERSVREIMEELLRDIEEELQRVKARLGA